MKRSVLGSKAQTMKISLKAIRAHPDRTVVFEQDKVTLLEGRNGVGKTSLIEAIYWCLYGKGNDLYKSACQVTVELGDFKVIRSTGPLKLIVENKDKKYEDEIAQAAIEEIFGTKPIFLCSSFFRQDQVANDLLSASSSQKLQLLSELTFSKEQREIKSFLEEIELERKRLKSKHHDLEVKYQTQKEIHDKNVFQPTIEAVMTDNSKVLEEKKLRLEKVKERQKILREQEHERRSALARRKQVQKDLEVINQTLSVETKGTPEDVVQLEQELVDLTSQIQRSNEKIKTKKNFDKLLLNSQLRTKTLYKKIETYHRLKKEQEQLRPKIPFDKIDPVQAMTQQKEWDHQAKILSRFPEIKSSSDLKARLEELELEYKELIEVEKEMRLFDEYKALKKKKDQIKVELIVSEGQISSLKLQLSNLTNSKQVYDCPNCSASVRLKGGRLVKSKVKPASDSQIAKLQDQIITLEKTRQIYLEKEKLKQEVRAAEKKLPPEIRYDEDLEDQKKEVMEEKALLSSLRFVEKPKVTPEQVRLYQRLEKVNLSLKDLHLEQMEEELESHRETMESLKKQLKSIQLDQTDHSEKLSQTRQKIDSVKKYLRALENQKRVENVLKEIQVPEDPKDELLDLDQEKKTLKQYISEYNLFTKQLERDGELRECRKVKDRVGREYQLAVELRQLATEVECYLIQTTVDNINEMANEILDNIFQGEIQIELSLFKTVKSKSKTVNQVNLQVISDKRKAFAKNSGGEKRVISFALTVALAVMNPSPLLMIDEALTSVDPNYRQVCISALKKYTSQCNKTVIMVNHNETEGDYDRVVRLES